MSQAARQPAQPQVLQQPYVQYVVQPAGDTELTKAAKDVSIVAVVIVIAIILIVVFSVYLIVRFLQGIVDEGGKIAPTVECAAWLEARRLGYMGPPPQTNPATNKPYTNCQAAAQAVTDSQTQSGGLCPVVPVPPPAVQQSPYLYYMAAQQCPT